MAVDKAMSDYVDKAVAKKVEEKWQGEDVKKMIAGEVKACTEKVIEGLSNEIVKMGRQVENTERGLRQFEFVCFAKRGSQLTGAMVQEQLKAIFGKEAVGRVHALNNTTFRIVPSLLGRASQMVFKIAELNKSPATALPFFADVSRSKQEQQLKRQRKERFEKGRLDSAVKTVDISVLENELAKRKEAAKKDK